jgi:hypothetical protein
LKAPVRLASNAMTWRRVDLPRWLGAIGKGLLVVSFATMMASTPYVFPRLFPLLFMGFFVMMVASYALFLAQIAGAGEIEVDGDVLVVRRGRRTRRVPLSDVASAMVVERSRFGHVAPYVEIELVARGAIGRRRSRGDILSVRAHDAASAHAMVEALGFGPGGRRVRADLAIPMRRLFHLPLAFVAYFAGGITTAVVAALVDKLGLGYEAFGSAAAFATLPIGALLWHAVLKRLVRAPVVIVGDDGIAIQGALRTRRLSKDAVVDASLRGETVAPFFRVEGGKLVSINGIAIDGARRLAIARVGWERVKAARGDAPSILATDLESGGPPRPRGASTSASASTAPATATRPPRRRRPSASFGAIARRPSSA